MIEAALRQAVERRAYRQAVIKDAAAFEATYNALRDAFTRAFGEGARAAIAVALDTLRDLDSDTFTEADARTVLKAVEGRMGAEAIRALLRGPVLNLTDVLMRLGVKEVGDAVGVDIAFGRPDLDALAILQEGNLYWVGNHWHAYTEERFRSVLTDYYTNGLTRAELTRRMAEDFGQLVDRSAVYWDTLADHTATRTREMGRVGAYDRAGVELVQVRAHLDAHTTRFCRAMHGRVIRVRKLETQRDAYLSAVKRDDMDAAKASWRMHGDTDLEGQKTRDLPDDTASPPYHMRCRTITVAYFQRDGDLGAWERKTYDREPLDKRELAALLERVRDARWSSPAKLKEHFDKHGKSFGGSLDAYNAAASDLIHRGDRDIYLSVRKGRLKAVFVRDRKSRKGTRHSVVTVDVEAREIASLHVRKKLATKKDDVQVIRQKGRGLAKWLNI